MKNEKVFRYKNGELRWSDDELPDSVVKDLDMILTESDGDPINFIDFILSGGDVEMVRFNRVLRKIDKVLEAPEEDI